jgi:hypothetical protein
MACYQAFSLRVPRCPFCWKVLRYKFGKKDREVKCRHCRRLVTVSPIFEEPAYAVIGFSDDDIDISDSRFFSLDTCVECGLNGMHTQGCSQRGPYTTSYMGSTLEKPMCPFCYAGLKVKRSCETTCKSCRRPVTVSLMVSHCTYDVTGYTDDVIPWLTHRIYISA